MSYRPLAAPRFSFGHEAHAPRDRAEMSADLLKSFGAELLAALPQGRPAADELAAPTAKSGGSAMRSASEELEVARTLRDAGDLAGAEQTLLAVAGAARARAAETLSTRELYTVIRASAGLAEVSVARDDWAAAEDAVKLALAASEALAPEVANRELALVAKPLAVAAVGSGHSNAARALLAWAEGVLRAGPGPNSRAGGGESGALRRAAPAGPRRARAARGPLAQRPPSLERRRRQAGAPRGVAAPVRGGGARRVVPGRPRRGAILRVRQGDGVRGGRGDAARPATGPRRGDAPAAARAGAATTTVASASTRSGTRRRYSGAATRCTRAASPRGGGGAATRVRSARHSNSAPAARRSAVVSDALLRSPSDDAAAAIKRALRRVATARQADWHLARDAGSAAFCARVNPSRSVDEIVDAMVVFGPPNLRAKAARDIGLSDATSVEIGNVLDTTHVNGPLRVNVVATAPARGRQAWTVHVVAAPPPDARRAHLAVGLGLDKTRRVEHFSVISRSDGATRRGALLRQTSWVLRFRAGKQPLLCAENGDASVDGRDAFRFATAGNDAATVCAGDRIDLFADLGTQVLRVRHGSRVYEVSLRRFGFDTGRLRPVVEVECGNQIYGAFVLNRRGPPRHRRDTARWRGDVGSPLDGARIAANPRHTGWRLRVATHSEGAGDPLRPRRPPPPYSPSHPF